LDYFLPSLKIERSRGIKDKFYSDNITDIYFKNSLQSKSEQEDKIGKEKTKLNFFKNNGENEKSEKIIKNSILNTINGRSSPKSNSNLKNIKGKSKFFFEKLKMNGIKL
jgi:hypothetical protein